ncbi:DoxX family protein [Nonomuraea africana]
MFTAYVVVTLVTIVTNLGAAIADFQKAAFVLANSARLGIPQKWLPMLATLKAAGAAGLVAGLLGVPYIGTAAAIGLVVFFVGAVALHVRAREFRKIAIPGGYLALAAASLALGVVP